MLCQQFQYDCQREHRTPATVMFSGELRYMCHAMVKFHMKSIGGIVVLYTVVSMVLFVLQRVAEGLEGPEELSPSSSISS